MYKFATLSDILKHFYTSLSSLRSLAVYYNVLSNLSSAFEESGEATKTSSEA